MSKHWHDLLPFYIAGQLPTAERIALEQHILVCEECRAALDEWRALANAVRGEAASRAADLPPLSPQLYRAQQDSAGQTPSTSSGRRRSFLRKWNIEEYVTIRRPSTGMEEDTDMHTTSDVSLVPARPLQFPEGRKLIYDPLTWVAAILVMIVLSALLLFMRASFNPGTGGAPEEAIPEFAAQPEGCAVETSEAQAESIRLADEATALLETEDDNTELALLLGICALQTVYMPEADTVVQRALVLADVVPEFPGIERSYDGARLSPDGRYLLIGSTDGAHLWDVETGAEVRTFPANYFVLTASVAFSPDGRYVLTTVGNTVARLWEVETGAEVRDFDAGVGIESVAISPDGTRIALGLENGQVQLWDTTAGTLVSTMTVHTGLVAYITFSPDGRTLLASGNGPGPYPLPQWDVEAGVKIRDFLGIQEAQSGIFSPDGRYVIAGGRPGDARAILWDAETGAEIRTFTDFPPGPEGFNHVQAFAFSPDGRYVLIGSANHTARIFEVETGAEVRSFNDNPSYVLTVAFSPDGRWILIASVSSVVRLWPTDYQDMIALACEHVTRDFTDGERTQYGLGDGPACS